MLLLIFLPGIAALQQSAGIYDDVQAIQRSHEQMQEGLFRIERLMLRASVTVREFLMDDSAATTSIYRQQISGQRKALDDALAELAHSVPPAQAGMFDQLRRQVDGYWQTLIPVLDWSPADRGRRALAFLRDQQKPRRESVLAVADEIVRLSHENYRQRYSEMAASQQWYRRKLSIAVGVAFLLGLAVSTWTVTRISRLERHAVEQSRATARAEQEMRTLSMRLMLAQEEERRKIARELHDEVGQMLTSLRLELGALDKLKMLPSEEYQQHLDEAKTTAEQTLRTVRDIAIGLRPSVLELGLEPALRWQARQFSRLTGTEAAVNVDGALPDLPEPYLTCMYRVVQEALTNSARHSAAQNVEIRVQHRMNELELHVTDDGIGLPPDWSGRRGMGLLGMEERVREVGGTFEIGSGNGAGVKIRVKLHVPNEDTDEQNSSSGS